MNKLKTRKLKRQSHWVFCQTSLMNLKEKIRKKMKRQPSLRQRKSISRKGRTLSGEIEELEQYFVKKNFVVAWG